MAKDNYQPAQVPVTNPDQAVGSTASGTSKLGTAVTNVNIADKQASAGATLRDIFMYGGAGILDSTLEASRASALKGFQKAIAPSQKIVSSLGPKITTAKSNITALQAELADPATSEKRKAQITDKLLPKATSGLAKMEKSLLTANTTISDQRESYTTSVETLMANAPKMTDLIGDKLPESAKLAADSKQYLAKMGQLGPAGESLNNLLAAGYKAGTITANRADTAQMAPIDNISADQIQASQMGSFGQANAMRAANVANVNTGVLGDRLMGEAVRRVDLRGSMDSEATRDAIQSARQGFAARGMATGNAALGAELLNRDRYQRQRAFQDLGFAQGVQGQDLERQYANQKTQLGISLSDQQAAMQAELANLTARYNAAVQQGDWDQAAAVSNQKANLEASVTNQDKDVRVGSFNVGEENRVGMFNAGLDLDAQRSQEENLRLANTANVGMAGDRYNLQTGVNNEALRGLALGSSLDSSANPYNMALGLYQGSGTNPGAAALAGATSVVNTANTLTNDANQYNAGATDFGHYAPMLAMGQYGNQQSGSTGIGNGVGTLLGGAAGMALAAPTGGLSIPAGLAIGSSLGGSGGGLTEDLIRSDKRLKKNIKDNEYGLEDIAKLKTYQYDYKDGADNEAGVMAQELRKVMPEAVEEVEMMDGKKRVKRLMIKPMFLTAALVNSVKELNGKVAALGSSFTSTKQKPKPMALGEALMELA